jgi:hypothetical protein
MKAEEIIHLLESAKASGVKGRLNKILEAKDTNLIKKIKKWWPEIEEALNFTTDMWKGDNPADEVSDAWDACNALLDKGEWEDKDIKAFKKEWSGSIVNALEFAQDSMADEAPSNWKPIDKAWEAIDKLLS